MATEGISSCGNALPAAALPDVLPTVETSLTVLSEVSGRPFRITPEELRRYTLLQVPLPRQTYDERMEARWAKLGGVRLYQRRCGATQAPLLSAHPLESSYPVWERSVYENDRLERE